MLMSHTVKMCIRDSILGDFISRVNSLYPVDMDNEELNSLLTTIKNQGEELVALNKEVELSLIHISL